MLLKERIEAAIAALVSVAAYDFFWYAVIAGVAWLLLFLAFPRFFRRWRIANFDPPRAQVAREVLHSLRTLAIYGLLAGLVAYAALGGRTRLYFEIAEFGWPWFFASVVLMVVLHDAYFYWTHRLMHHPRLFRRLHQTHHLSTNPTPWGAYAFSPWEALVQGGIGPLIVFVIPSHPAALALFMAWQIAISVLGHCGHETFPHRFVGSWAGRVLNTSTHHAMHHEKPGGNYGMYFNVWDRLMSTNHRDYQQRFEQVVAGRRRDEP